MIRQKIRWTHGLDVGVGFEVVVVDIEVVVVDNEVVVGSETGFRGRYQKDQNPCPNRLVGMVVEFGSEVENLVVEMGACVALDWK